MIDGRRLHRALLEFVWFPVVLWSALNKWIVWQQPERVINDATWMVRVSASLCRYGESASSSNGTVGSAIMS